MCHLPKQNKFIWLLVLLLASSFFPGLRGEADADGETPVNGTTTELTEYLVMDREASVPFGEISYSVSPGKAIAATDTTLEVRPGIGVPSVTSVSFRQGDATFDQKQKGDSVRLVSGQKYVRKSVTVDFTGIMFTEPGVYRYVITQRCMGLGILEDAEVSRTLDVYIQDQGDYLAVLNYVMFAGEEVAAPAPSMEVSGGIKSRSFQNLYATQNLSFGLEAAGLGSERNRQFPLTLEISGAEAGTIYVVDLGRSTGTTGQDHLTVGEDGRVIQVFRLRDGEYVTVKGLAQGTTYALSVEEETGEYRCRPGTRTVAIQASGKRRSENYVPTKRYTDPPSGIVGTEDIHTGFTMVRGWPLRIYVLTGAGALVLVAAGYGLIRFFIRHRTKSRRKASSRRPHRRKNKNSRR